MNRNALRIAFSFAAALSALAGFAPSLQAQCEDVYRLNLVDLDQRREEAPGIFGLQWNGASHCVPASWADNFAFMSNHGLPQLTINQQYDWNDPSSYNVAGVLIAILGNLMGTTSGGTGTGLPGLTQFVNDRAPGSMAFGAKGYVDGNPPNAKDLRELLLAGGFGVVVRGFYEPADVVHAPQLSRTGGHIHALRGVHDFCDTTPVVSTRDPNTSDSRIVQSPFSTVYQRLEKVTRTFYIDGTLYERTLYYWPDSSTPAVVKFFDGFSSTIPTVSLSGKPKVGNEPSGIDFVRPITLTGGPNPTHGGTTMPPGTGTIRGLHIDPSLAYAWVVADKDTGGSRVIRVGMGSGQAELKVELEDLIISSMTAHNGRVYVATATQLIALNRNADDVVAPVGTARILTPVRAMCESDSTGQIIAIQDLATGGHGISRTPLDLAQPMGPIEPCPPGVNFIGDIAMAVHPTTGEVLACSTGVDVIHRMTTNAAGGWQLVGSIALPAGSAPSNPMWTDTGSIIFTNGGVVAELEQDASGGWQPKASSYHAGRVVVPGQKLAIPHTRPAAEVPNDVDGVSANIAEEGLPSNPDTCSADFDSDGDAGTDADIEAFFACLAGDCCTTCLTSDFDGDGDAGTDADIEAFFRVLAGNAC